MKFIIETNLSKTKVAFPRQLSFFYLKFVATYMYLAGKNVKARLIYINFFHKKS